MQNSREETIIMTMIRSVVIAATTTLLYCMSLSTAVAKDEPKNIGNAVRVLKSFNAVKKGGIPPALLKSALGIVIIPGATKNDFMVSGKNVSGILLVHETDGKWSNPVFVKISGGTLGWQIVGEPMDIVLVFKNRERIDAILKDKLYMDAKVKVVAGPLGKTTQNATNEELKAEILSYIRSRGVFYDVSAASTTLKIDNAANDNFYGKAKINTGDILSGKVEKTSDDVKNLQKILTEFATGK